MQYKAQLTASTALACILATTGAFAQTQTAQSAMVPIITPVTAFEVETEITWSFNRGNVANPGTAMSYFSNAQSSGPVVSCSGPGCATTTQPAAPAAPAPSEQTNGNDTRTQKIAQDNRCIFYNGG